MSLLVEISLARDLGTVSYLFLAPFSYLGLFSVYKPEDGCCFFLQRGRRREPEGMRTLRSEAQHPADFERVHCKSLHSKAGSTHEVPQRTL